MRVRVTGTFALAFLVLAVASAHTQVLPPLLQSPPSPAQAPAPPQLPAAPGFVSAYEIMHTLRAAGFDPLAPPLREGTIYVARATDYRGILMRVVLDARTGAIRDANRILPGPGNYGGSYGGAYGPEPYSPGPNGPGGSERAGIVPPPYRPPQDANTSTAPAAVHPATGGSVTPRPRPPELASRKSAEGPKPAATVDPEPDSKPSATTAVPAPSAAAQAAPSAPAPAKPSKTPSTLSISN